MCVLLLDSLRDNIRIPFVRVSTFSLGLHTKIIHGQNSTILVPNSSTKMSGWKGENFPQNLVPFIWTVCSGDLKDNFFLVYFKSFEQVLMLQSRLTSFLEVEKLPINNKLTQENFIVYDGGRPRKREKNQTRSILAKLY